MEKFEEHVVIWIANVKILIAIFSKMKAHVSFGTITNCKIKLLFKLFEKICNGLGGNTLLSLFFMLLTHQKVELLQSFSKFKVKFFDLLSSHLNAVDFYIKDLILNFLHKENRWECLIDFIDRYNGVFVIFEFVPVVLRSSFYTVFSGSSRLLLLLLVFMLISHNLFPKLFRV